MKRLLPVINTGIFLAIAVGHILRLAYSAPVDIGTITIAPWLSGIVALIALGLAWLNWGRLKRPGKKDYLSLIIVIIVIDLVGALYSWVAGLSYWNLEGDSFLLAAVLDLVLIVLLTLVLKRK